MESSPRQHHKPFFYVHPPQPYVHAPVHTPVHALQWPLPMMPVSYNPYCGYPGLGFGVPMAPYPPGPYMDPPAYVLPHSHLHLTDYRRMLSPQYYQACQARHHYGPGRETTSSEVQTEPLPLDRSPPRPSPASENGVALQKECCSAPARSGPSPRDTGLSEQPGRSLRCRPDILQLGTPLGGALAGPSSPLGGALAGVCSVCPGLGKEERLARGSGGLRPTLGLQEGSSVWAVDDTLLHPAAWLSGPLTEPFSELLTEPLSRPQSPLGQVVPTADTPRPAGEGASPAALQPDEALVPDVAMELSATEVELCAPPAGAGQRHADHQDHQDTSFESLPAHLPSSACSRLLLGLTPGGRALGSPSKGKPGRSLSDHECRVGLVATRTGGLCARCLARHMSPRQPAPLRPRNGPPAPRCDTCRRKGALQPVKLRDENILWDGPCPALVGRPGPRATRHDENVTGQRQDGYISDHRWQTEPPCKAAGRHLVLPCCKKGTRPHVIKHKTSQAQGYHKKDTRC